MDIDSVTYYCYHSLMIGKSDDWPDRALQHTVLREGEAGEGRDEQRRPSTGEDRLTLGELTAATDVSVRTVRYYIAEGLLPPPEGSGPGSAYTQGHLGRLRLIQRLKEAYLPLKEIRRRLSGLSDDEVKILLAADDDRAAPVASPPSESLYDESLAGARDYLALLESREQYRTEPMALQFPAAAAPMEAAPEPDFMPQPARSRGPRAANTVASTAPRRDEPVASPGTGLWHRIPLGDEAELVISDRIYGRHRDRIDWLVRWARKVFN
jgi:DNA-binding transcriptional MerR regulator